jgi:hypothetical protein
MAKKKTTRGKVLSFHIGDKLFAAVQKLQGEALLEGVSLTQQDVMRGCLHKGVAELQTYHEPKVKVRWIKHWISQLKG